MYLTCPTYCTHSRNEENRLLIIKIKYMKRTKIMLILVITYVLTFVLTALTISLVFNISYHEIVTCPFYIVCFFFGGWTPLIAVYEDIK